jgi:hypothetical protein
LFSLRSHYPNFREWKFFVSVAADCIRHVYVIDLVGLAGRIKSAATFLLIYDFSVDDFAFGFFWFRGFGCFSWLDFWIAAHGCAGLLSGSSEGLKLAFEVGGCGFDFVDVVACDCGADRFDFFF